MIVSEDDLSTQPAFLANAPVRSIPTDSASDEPEEGIALCLSGGGYRAMLFHLGALWRLNNAGLLPQLKRISSVSGGSITAGVLGLAWSKLEFSSAGVAGQFTRDVVKPIRKLAGKTIDLWATLFGLFGPGLSADYVATAYRRYLYAEHTLQNLPDDGQGPRFVINASNLQSGALWRFSKPYMRDYRVGVIPNPTLQLATAVAASSAFPPVLSPAILHLKASEYTPDPLADLHYIPFTTKVVLSDGGVYDNLGLETAWKRYRTVLVSDGGAKMMPVGKPRYDWFSQFFRVRDIEDDQVRSLRKRQLQDSYALPAGTPGQRYGAYWSMRADITSFRISTTLNCPYKATSKLARVPTRLAKLCDRKQMELINWGFAVCDVSLRRAVQDGHLSLQIEPAVQFPYPDAGWK